MQSYEKLQGYEKRCLARMLIKKMNNFQLLHSISVKDLKSIFRLAIEELSYWEHQLPDSSELSKIEKGEVVLKLIRLLMK